MSLPRASYQPAWWIPGPHLKTMWGRFLRRPPIVPVHVERWELPDGDFLDIHRLAARKDAPDVPRVVLLHGLEGSPTSHYALGLLQQARDRGWAADAIVFRSCGAEPNRLARSYHSGETTDLDFVIRRLIDAEPDRTLLLAGVSLGGNVLLKWLGEHGDSVPHSVRAAAAVSVPYDLARSARRIDRGFSKVYQASFLRSLRRKAHAKHARFPDILDAALIDSARSFYQFDDCVTARLHGFTGADDYYSRSSSLGFLAHIRVPTLLLSAVDDPFLPREVLDDVRAIARENLNLHVEFPERGGHVGFISGRLPWKSEYYAERRAMEFLAESIRDGDAALHAG